MQPASTAEVFVVLLGRHYDYKAEAQPVPAHYDTTNTGHRPTV